MNLAFRLQRYVKQIEKGWQALCLSSTSDIWITQCEENLLPALQTLWLHPPKSCSSWLFRRAFSCWWNLCWSEHICSKYWQVLLLSVWNRCLIPSDVFWRQIFFFCRVAKVCRVETLFFFFSFHVFMLSNVRWRKSSWSPSRGSGEQVCGFRWGPQRSAPPCRRLPAWCQSGTSSQGALGGSGRRILSASGKPLTQWTHTHKKINTKQ